LFYLVKKLDAEKEEEIKIKMKTVKVFSTE